MSAMGRSGLKLHLGCGMMFVAGWENLDKSPNIYLSRIPRVRDALVRGRILSPEHAAVSFRRGTIHVDVAKGLPYADGSAAYIYHSHLVEHLSRWQALALVRECARVLKPGGLMRVATPDLRKLVDWYLRDDYPFGEGTTAADTFMDVLGTYRDIPGSTAQRLIRRLVSTRPHQWLYDKESLCHLLEEGGFRDPVARNYREGEVPDLDQLDNRPDHSLYVEARRP
jgi:predicted SAM-dependent methyltransferase